MTQTVEDALKLAIKKAHMLVQPVPDKEVTTMELAKAVSEQAVELCLILEEALAVVESATVQEPVGDDWTPCMKRPVVVHVRQQRPGESHVSTREGITPVKSDDLIMRGVSGEEYPIGRAIFEQTYTLDTTPPATQPAVPLTTMQPLVNVNGVTRFKKNGLVDALYEHGVKTGLGMNELHCMDFSDEDRTQFAQLIGYSLSGYGSLSYVSDESYEAAEQSAPVKGTQV